MEVAGSSETLKAIWNRKVEGKKGIRNGGLSGEKKEWKKKKSFSAQYGNTGCGVFKGGIENQKGFQLKINSNKMKVLNFENWGSNRLSKIKI